MLTCKMKIKESAKFNSTCIFFYGLQYYNSITFTADPCYDYIWAMQIGKCCIMTQSLSQQ